MHRVSRDSSTVLCKGQHHLLLQLSPDMCHVGPMPPRERDQAVLCLPLPLLRHRKVTALSPCQPQAAGVLLRKEDPGSQGVLLPPFCCLQAARHRAELPCDNHQAVFKIKYPFAQPDSCFYWLWSVTLRPCLFAWDLKLESEVWAAS